MQFAIMPGKTIFDIIIVVGLAAFHEKICESFKSSMKPIVEHKHDQHKICSISKIYEVVIKPGFHIAIKVEANAETRLYSMALPWL